MSGILSAFIGRVAGVVTDAYFNLVTLLLPGNGTNGAQNNTFLDSSTNNFTITRNGNTTQGTFSPFSQTGWSNSFASGAVLNLNGGTPLTFGTGDFTIEFWVYYNGGLTADVALYDSRDNVSGNGVYPLLYSNTTGKMVYYVSSAARITSTTTLVVGTWYHVALARSGTSTKLFINGIQEGSTYTDSNNYLLGTNRPSIGAAGISLGADPLNGYMSNVRVVKGRAVYTSAFTPPTEPLGATSGGQNPPTGTQTSLLTCQSNRFADNGGLATPNTINIGGGTPSVQAFSPFAPTAAYSAATVGGSGYFDGSGDYLTWGSGSSVAFGTGDFTVEAFVYVTSTPNTKYIVDARDSSNTGAWAFAFGLGGTGYKLGFFDGTTTIEEATASAQVNAWQHCVAVRSGTTLSVYLNGSRVATATNSKNLNVSPTTSYVGTRYTGSGYDIVGYISTLRIVKGTAVYDPTQTTLTIPTSPLTAITNTVLLLNFTNAGITDATAKNVLETVGNAQISTTQSKFGGASIAFDGTGDWLLIPHTVDQMLGTGAFTIEMWVYRNSSGTYGLVGKGTGTTGWLVSLNSSNQVVFTYGSSTITSAGTISATTWTYIAVVREGTGTNQTKIYISGSNDGTGTVSTDFNQTNAMYVGADRTGGSAFNGYIDDLRITKGYARTIATPSSAFALQ